MKINCKGGNYYYLCVIVYHKLPMNSSFFLCVFLCYFYFTVLVSMDFHDFQSCVRRISLFEIYIEGKKIIFPLFLFNSCVKCCCSIINNFISCLISCFTVLIFFDFLEIKLACCKFLSLFLSSYFYIFK